ncbi:MAG: tRNA (guanine-N1)-methyltransferase [Thaumarchaeota archaeon]|nr:tRNA (guanine-N1)-methyltransferase [Nitrososphaerota archaeon]
MQTSLNNLEITEGRTRILVPSDSINSRVPPREPAFFNPRARLNRDFSVIAYSAFLENFEGPKIFLDGLAGIGARGLRIANEVKGIEKVIVNDLNPSALNLGLRSAKLNNLLNYEISENETCRFLSSHSKKGSRATIVDVDPFGSPSKYIDCAIRATMHGGLFSATATDLQVLHGLANDACKRRYYGVPVKTEYGNEIAIRLVLGCINMVAARFDIEIVPLFVENEMHYYRAYVKILNKSAREENMGYILHCNFCGNRAISEHQSNVCNLCNSKIMTSGPLWIGQLFSKEFSISMLEQVPNCSVDKKCEKILQRCALEAEMPGTYFTLDEIAAKMKCAPLSLKKAINKLQNSGFLASPTSLNFKGLRTNANINELKEIFAS